MNWREAILYPVTLVILAINVVQAQTAWNRWLNVLAEAFMVAIIAADLIWPGWQQRLVARFRSLRSGE